METRAWQARPVGSAHRSASRELTQSLDGAELRPTALADRQDLAVPPQRHLGRLRGTRTAAGYNWPSAALVSTAAIQSSSRSVYFGCCVPIRRTELRVDRRCPGVLLGVLRSLQPRPPPRRHRAPHPRLGPLRHRRRDPDQPGRHTHRCPQREPCPIPPPTTHTTQAPLDQRTQPRSTHPIRIRSCLIPLDTFRLVRTRDGHLCFAHLRHDARPARTVPTASATT